MGQLSKFYYDEISQATKMSPSQLAGHLRNHEAGQQLSNLIRASEYGNLDTAVVLEKKRAAVAAKVYRLRCKGKDDKFRCGEGKSKVVEMKRAPRPHLKQVAERVLLEANVAVVVRNAKRKIVEFALREKMEEAQKEKEKKKERDIVKKWVRKYKEKQQELKQVEEEIIRVIKTASFNMRTANNGNIEELARVMKQLNIDIAAIQETKRISVSEWGTIISNIDSSKYIFYGNGRGDSEKGKGGIIGGIGFLLSTELADHVVQPAQEILDLCNSRLAVLYIVSEEGLKLAFVNVYAPCNDHTEEIRENYYTNLSKVLSKIPIDFKTICLGDFNARIAKNWTLEELEEGAEIDGSAVVGNFTDPKVLSNDRNGDFLLEVCEKNKLAIASTFHDNNVGTWMHTNRNKEVSEYTLDHILTNQDNLDMIITCNVDKLTGLNSDHHPIILSLGVEIKKVQRKREKKGKKVVKVNRKLVKQESEKYSQSLSDKLEAFNQSTEGTVDDSNTEFLVESLKNMMKETVNVKHLQQKTRKHKVNDWYEREDKFKELRITESRNLKNYRRNPTDENNQALKEVRKVIRKLIKKSKSAASKRTGDILLETLDSDPRAHSEFAQKILSNVFKSRKIAPKAMKNKAGEIQTDPKEINKVWVQFVTDLFNNIRNVNMPEVQALIDVIGWTNEHDQPIEVNEALGVDFTAEEFRIAIKKSNNNKATGSDDISAEEYKHLSSPNLLSFLAKLLNLCKSQGEVPKSLKEVIICLLHKKGDRDVCDNYRTISLIKQINKIMLSVIMNRITKNIEIMSTKFGDNILPQSQAGFRPKRDRCEMIFAILSIFEDHWARNIPVYAMFVDKRKAFDYVPRGVMTQVLLSVGIPTNIVNLLMSFNNGATAKIKTDGAIIEGESIELNEGLLQGSNASPFLFILFFAAMWRIIKAKLNEKGISYIVKIDGANGGQQGSFLEFMFADDVAIITETASGMQEVACVMEEVSTTFGMEIAYGKTEILFQQKREGELLPAPAIVNSKGVLYKVVKHFKYLGCVITPRQRSVDNVKNNPNENDVSRRIQFAWCAFQEQRAYLSDFNIKLELRINRFNSNVFTIFSQCVGIRALTETDTQRMESAYFRMLKIITGKKMSDMASKVKTYIHCKVLSLETRMKYERLKWVMRCNKMDENRWARIFLRDKKAIGGDCSVNHLITTTDFEKDSYLGIVMKDMQDFGFLDPEWQFRIYFNNVLDKVPKFKNEIKAAAIKFEDKMKYNYFLNKHSKDISERNAIKSALREIEALREKEKKEKDEKKAKKRADKEKRKNNNNNYNTARSEREIVEEEVNEDFEGYSEFIGTFVTRSVTTMSGRKVKPSCKLR